MSTVYQTAETAAEAQRKVQAKARGLLLLKLIRVLDYCVRDLEVYPTCNFEFTWGDDQARFSISQVAEENVIVSELKDGLLIYSDKARLIASLLKEAR